MELTFRVTRSRIASRTKPSFSTSDHPAPKQANHLPDPSAELDIELQPIQPLARARLDNANLDDYPSPAFLKRARISYGSLFEDGLDVHEDDGGVKGNGRKRTRFGRESGAWKYVSRSPSPETAETPVPAPEPEPEPEDAVTTERNTPGSPPARRLMMDEGCQTVEIDMSLAPPLPQLAPPRVRASDRSTSPSATQNGVKAASEEPTTASVEIVSSLGSIVKSTGPFGSALFGSYAPVTAPFDAVAFLRATGDTGFGTGDPVGGSG